MTELELTRQFFDEKSEIWDSRNRMQKEQRLLEIFNTDLPDLQSPLLDMGSGTGILIPILENKLQKPAKIIEYDISLSMLKKAHRKHHFKKNTSFIQADGHVLPFKNESFPNIMCFAVYPHFTDPMKAVNEMYRILIHDGLLIILHLMGHQELNAMHETAGKVVSRHALQSAETVSLQIIDQGFNILNCHEQKDLYLIVARKL
jgi:ubiquinone/menaquinone biosynthesis C-methylase UbiE